MYPWCTPPIQRRYSDRPDMRPVVKPSSGLEPETPSLPSSNEAGTAGKAGKPRARKSRKKKESPEDE